MFGGAGKATEVKDSYVRLVTGVAIYVVVMVVMGPFGQGERFMLSQRLGLWVLYVLLGFPIMAGIHDWLYTRWRGRDAAGTVGRIVLSALIATVPVLGVVEAIGLAEGRPLPRSAEDFVRSGLEVMVAALPFMVLLEGYRNRQSAGAVPLASAEMPDMGFWRDLGEVNAFCAQGHYTRVYTASGQRFVDKPFADMLAMAAATEGVQVHRSWWVARAAVDRIDRKGSSAQIAIRGGVSVPVARRRMLLLRRCGWPV